LESLLTSTTWTDRLLGQNSSVTATNDRLWLATGNNAAFGGDLARRIATVSLDPPEADHHLRTDFRIKSPDGWVQAHRGKLLAAMLTIARAWFLAGRPSTPARSDDYATWVEGIRGLMHFAGFQGAFGGSVSTIAVSADDEEWHAFLIALFDEFGADPFTVKDIVDHLHRVNPFNSNGGNLDTAALPGDLPQRWAYVRDGNDGGFRKSLGWWLRNHEGRYAAGWALVSAGKVNRQPNFAVKKPKA
jgi:hypothetical protein